MKKILLILALLCAVAQGALAQNYDVWDGVTMTQPGYVINSRWSITYQINTAAEMAWLMNKYNTGISVYIAQDDRWMWCRPRLEDIDINADLDMTAANWITLTGTTDNNSGYYGYEGSLHYDVTLNGKGHTVKIKIDNGTSSDNYQGLFYGIGENAKVKNLHVDCNIKVGNARKVGGICGENLGTIENCWVSGHVESNHYNTSLDADLGGIAGLNESGGTIKYCCVTADIKNTAKNSGVGGIAGSNDGTIQHVTFYGSVSVEHSQDNKWVGDQDKTLENNYDSFDSGEYDAASGKDLYRQAIKYPYTVTVNTMGHGTIRTWAASEYNVPGTRAGETFSLDVTSGTAHSVIITDADGNNVSLQGHANDWSSFWFVMPHKDVNVNVVFESLWPGCTTGTGESGNPYIIDSADDWNEFAQSVYLGNTHSGKYVKLTNNISVTTMAGGYQSDESYTPFSGTFDGDGHTLTLNVSKQSRFAAPFKCVSGATIKNLRTAGTIDGTGNADGKLLAGIVGVSFGNNTITGCVSSVTLRTDYSNDAAMAGLVAGTKGGSLTISGCVFNGSLQGGATSGRCAGFSGYEYTTTTTSISNSLFAPTSITVPTNDGYTKTFTRDDDATITGCYYTQTLGTAQGSLAIFTTYAPSALGSLVQDYGMVKAYQNGLLFDGKYYFAPTTSTGTGTEDDPYIISNAGHWDTFVYDVNNNDNYNGKYVWLAADISVSAMVGTSEAHSFQGTFLGNNHTITFTKGTSESAFGEQYCAPFRYTKNATIKDLKTSGAIYTSQKFATGLISYSYGTTIITNCHVGTDIYSRVSGDGTHGAFVAYPEGPVNITGSSFTGHLLTKNGTHSCGGFVAWHNNKTITVTNSLYAPNGSIPDGWTAIGNGATFVRGNNENITNCYYTETLGDAQGTKAYTLATAPANLGSLVQDYGMLKAYQNGILFGDTYYAVLNLSGAGTEADPYIIGNADQWNDFANYVTNGYQFSGKFVKLNADINVSTMAGTSDANSFRGTFDGGGHTLTFTKGTSGSPFDENYCAPFRHVKDATIKNLHVDGTITTSAQFAAGIVGESHRNLNITNCRSSVAINSSKSGDGTHGGFVSTLSGKDNTIIIDGCVFDGSFATTNGTTNCGGFIGWPVYNRPVIKNSLMKPSSVAAGMLNNTFARWYTGDGGIYEPTITNCYYVATTNLPTNQGLGYSFASAPANIGTAGEAYTTSGITPYTSGLLYDGRYYMTPEAISLANTGTNDVVSIEGYFADVTLADRTLYKDGAWNTLCLPFNVTLAGSPLAGATARPLTAASISGTTLNLTFGDAVSTLTAGTPYIIKWASGANLTEADLVFNGVTIDKTDRSFDNEAEGDARVRFIGTYKSTMFDATDNTVLLLGGNNKLYYPGNGAGIGAQRAYFKLGSGEALARQLTAFNIDFGDESTGIITISKESGSEGASTGWFTLDGRRLDGKPTMKGIYVNNGMKVIVK